MCRVNEYRYSRLTCTTALVCGGMFASLQYMAYRCWNPIALLCTSVKSKPPIVVAKMPMIVHGSPSSIVSHCSRLFSADQSAHAGFWVSPTKLVCGMVGVPPYALENYLLIVKDIQLHTVTDWSVIKTDEWLNNHHPVGQLPYFQDTEAGIELFESRAIAKCEQSRLPRGDCDISGRSGSLLTVRPLPEDKVEPYALDGRHRPLLQI